MLSCKSAKAMQEENKNTSEKANGYIDDKAIIEILSRVARGGARKIGEIGELIIPTDSEIMKAADALIKMRGYPEASRKPKKTIYDKEKLFRRAIDVIRKNRLCFIEDIIPFLPVVRQTFYDYFPTGSDKMVIIREELDANKIEIKESLKRKWFNSDNATLQIALYKTICTEDERRRLATNYSELTGKNGESLNGNITVNVVASDYNIHENEDDIDDV
jgi:hypothetical protein